MDTGPIGTEARMARGLNAIWPKWNYGGGILGTATIADSAARSVASAP